MPEGYVRGLEKLWGLAIRDVDAVEDQMLVALAGDEESKFFHALSLNLQILSNSQRGLLVLECSGSSLPH